jgi:hypothetical protein
MPRAFLFGRCDIFARRATFLGAVGNLLRRARCIPPGTAFRLTAFRGGQVMDDNDPFEQGKRACFNREPHHNPYPKDSEAYRRWEAGYKFVERGLVAV